MKLLLLVLAINMITFSKAQGCPDGEYGGCGGTRCESQVCCCMGMDGGCYFQSCPEGQVYNGEVVWTCAECPGPLTPPTDYSVCVDPASIGC